MILHSLTGEEFFFVSRCGIIILPLWGSGLPKQSAGKTKGVSEHNNELSGNIPPLRPSTLMLRRDALPRRGRINIFWNYSDFFNSSLILDRELVNSLILP